MKQLVLVALVLFLAACREEAEEKEPLVRGLKTHLVTASEAVSLRSFPAVLEASEVTTLSFEVGGRLERITLDVGQRVGAGETIATLDTVSLLLSVDIAQSNVVEAEASAKNAAENAERQAELFSRGSVTKVVADDAQTQSDIANASLVQARTSLETARENLNKATLTVPFDAIINSVEVESFGTISAGTPIVQIYPIDSFEVSFSVNFDSVNRLVVGKPARVRLADRPDIVLDAVVSEIGARADAVSSFPIVLTLRETHPLLKAGMAVEASMEFELPVAEGFAIPLTAILNDGKKEELVNARTTSQAGVFVFDPDTSTISRRSVTISGIRENELIVIDGLSEGERIASAGVSFLREGQQVNLLTDEG